MAAAAEVAELGALGMVAGLRENMFLVLPTLALSANSSALTMTRPSSTLASTSRSTTTSPSRPPVKTCLSPSSLSPTHLWTTT